MSLEKDISDKLVAIVDENRPYRIVRRLYDDEFADAHGISLEDIVCQRFVPCLECGEDIVPKVIVSRNNGKIPVYCSPKCRLAHSKTRLTKITEDTDINAFAKTLIKKCLNIDGEARTKRTKGAARLSVTALMRENNELLREILKELQNGQE